MDDLKYNVVPYVKLKVIDLIFFQCFLYYEIMFHGTHSEENAGHTHTHT